MNPTIDYSPAAYLRDRAPAICICAVCMALAASVLAVFGLKAEPILLVCAVIAASFAGSLIWGYARRARYYHDLTSIASQVESAQMAVSLLDEPSFLEGRISHQAQSDLVRICGEEINAQREDAQAYREYVELWIHEVKTPIAAAKLLLAHMHGSDAAKLAGEVERIESQVDHALYYARSTSLANDYAIREASLGDVARDAVKRNARLLVERGVQPRFDIPDEATVLTDETWVGFVLSQAVVNSAKYGARSIEFRSYEQEAGTPRGRTVLEVVDDGCGIPAQDVPRVFDRGFTGENGRAYGQATGMGLYLSAIMCEKMGVGIAVASEKGAGTRVILTFPHDRRRLGSD